MRAERGHKKGQPILRISLQRRLLITCAAFALLLLAGCNRGASAQETLLLWHDWPGGDAEVLNSPIEKFERLNPDINVVAQYIPAAEFVARYAEQVNLGFGPDLILTSAQNTQALYQRGFLLSDLRKHGITADEIYAPVLAAYSDGENLFGLPFSKSSQILFYDKRRVSRPPGSLEELVDGSPAHEYRIGMNPSFIESFWGVQAYGGRLRDAEGNIALQDGGLTNWLIALQNTQASSLFVLNEDQNTLRQDFIDGYISLYVAHGREFNTLREAIGAENLGVALLPAGNAGRPAGPLLDSSGLSISHIATTGEIDVAVRLAQFLTSERQQMVLTTGEVGRLPANSNVRISPAMPDVTTVLANQSRAAAPLAFADNLLWQELSAYGADEFWRMLAGDVNVNTSVAELAARLSVIQGTVVPSSSAIACAEIDAPQRLTLWHGWSDASTSALEAAVDAFVEGCPDVEIQLTRIEDNETLFTLYGAAVDAGGGPDILLDSTQWSARYAAAGQIANLSQVADPAKLARFVPQAQANVRYQEQLFALPLTARSVALYYNPELIAVPPVTLDELLFRLDTEHRLAMPLTFQYDLFGVEAFGGHIFDEETGLVVNSNGMVQWLEWLRTAGAHAGMIFTADRRAAEDLFATGEASMMVGGPASLQRLREDLTPAQLLVAPLPAGPMALAGPILETEGVMFNPALDADSLRAGLAFANYLTTPAAVEILVRSGEYVPANVNVDLSEYPVLAGFRNAAQTAAVISQGPEWEAVFTYGDKLYTDVVRNGVDAAEALEAFADAVNAANAARGAEDAGVELAPAP